MVQIVFHTFAAVFARHHRHSFFSERIISKRIEAVIGRGGRAVFFRTVDATGACLQDVDDAGNHSPIIEPPYPGWFFGTYGSIAAHCSSFNQNSLLVEPSILPMDGVNHDLPLLLEYLIECRP